MKILVISDSHGNIANLKHVLGFGQKIKAGAVIHSGDWNTLESVDTVLSFNIPLYTVLGNADIDTQIIDRLRTTAKKFGEEYLEFEIGGKKIGVTHKPSDIKKYFGGKKPDIVFCGHYHSKDENVSDGIRIVRAGAIINGINFAVYNTSSGTIEFVNE